MNNIRRLYWAYMTKDLRGLPLDKVQEKLKERTGRIWKYKRIKRYLSYGLTLSAPVPDNAWDILTEKEKGDIARVIFIDTTPWYKRIWIWILKRLGVKYSN